MKSKKKVYTDAEKIAAFDVIFPIFHESYSHHEFCGWGDNWERECAGSTGSNLIQRMADAVEKYPEEA